MRTLMIALTLFIAVIALAAPLCVTDSSAEEVYGVSESVIDFYRGNKLIQEWRIGEARELTDSLLAKTPQDAPARLIDAHVLFFEGSYEEALKRLEELGERGNFYELVKTTHEATKKMQSRSSEHFELFWDNPRDEVLVESALEGLEKVREALAERMEFTQEGKIRVEIYPTLADFTSVSTLTREEVETTGIIGLCKFNRLMITSPRATVWGYRWRDTLSHEMLHLLIFKLSRGRAPIWVHEGVAKHFESSWRGEEGKASPFSLALLTQRHEEGTLISLEAMSPSIAKLPSSEDASVAFAQVGTMMNYLAEKRGPDAPIEVVAAMGEGLGDRAALERAWGSTFKDFEESWQDWVGELPLRNGDIEVVGITLRDGHESGEGEVAEEGSVPDPVARDFVRLGDMLMNRGRSRAATVEYGKAYYISPKMPAVASRYAGGQLRAGEYAEALSALEGVLDLYEDRGVLWFKKGEALSGLGRHGEAIDAYLELMEINPFDLPGRVGLMVAATEAGDTELAQEQHRALGVLGALEGGVGHDNDHGAERDDDEDKR